MSDPTTFATCALCGERIEAGEILVHLAIEHDLEEGVQEWPDGSPVVIDQTLTPEDFDV